MPLPIIILFERHWDTVPAKVTKKLVSRLFYEGYDTLCCEAPNDLTASEMIFRIKSNLYNELYEDAIKYLEGKGVEVNGELGELTINELLSLLHSYVSTKKINNSKILDIDPDYIKQQRGITDEKVYQVWLLQNIKEFPS